MVKNSPANAGHLRDMGSVPWSGRSPGEEMAMDSSILAEKSHGQRSLVGCHPWGCEESDTAERLHFHVLLSCTGEGNGNPLQCSCLENPRDGRAWWTAVYRVAQSQTRLKRLSSSSSSTTTVISFTLLLKATLVTMFRDQCFVNHYSLENQHS